MAANCCPVVIQNNQPPVLLDVPPRTTIVMVPPSDTVVQIDPQAPVEVQVTGVVVLPDVRIVEILVNDGPAGPQGPPGPGGGTDFLVPAGEPISAGRAITIEDDQAFLFDATTAASYGKLAGISATATGTIGANITVVARGLAGLGGLTPDGRYYANGADGEIGTVPGSVLVAPVGYAVDADTFFVSIDTQLER